MAPPVHRFPARPRNHASRANRSFPHPSVRGAPGARITYVGNLSNPSTVKITPSGTLARDHVTVKGFELVGGFVLTGNRDSIAFCLVGGSKPQLTGSDESVI